MDINLRALNRITCQSGPERLIGIVAGSLLLVAMAASVEAQEDPRNLGLVTKEYVLSNYLGSFKVDHKDGTSTTSYGKGRVAYHPGRNSVFIDSHVYELAIGEFQIPEVLSTSADKSLLPNAQLSIPSSVLEVMEF